MKNRIGIPYRTIAVALLLLASIGSFAQLNPLSGQYFNNRYLGNPAFAGIDSGVNLSLSYRKLWANMPGSPELQRLTADFGKKRAGLGLNVELDRAGLQRQTRVVGTYAYHLPLNGEQALHFGVSLGVMDRRLSTGDINGNPGDPLAAAYNERKAYVDGDFGLAYTGRRFGIELSLPNLNELLGRSELKQADVATFYAAMNYRLGIGTGMSGATVEPKVAYRGVRGFDNILDAGANLSLANEQLMLMAMYHSNESASFGLGFDYKRRYMISAAYTTQTSQLNSYTNGSFELGLKLHLGK